MNAKSIRTSAGKSRAWVAAMAGCSEPTCKLFEVAGPDAVGERPRAALAAVYAQLEAQLGAAPTSTGGRAA